MTYKTFRILFCINALSLVPLVADAALTMTLTGSSGSSIVNYELTGSSIATVAGSLAPGSRFIWDNVGFEAFSIELNNKNVVLASGTPFFSNDTTSMVSNIGSLYFDDDGAGDDYGATVSGSIFSWSSGDTISWSGSGTADLSVVASSVDFNDMSTGMSAEIVDKGITSQLVIADAVPEPTSSMLVILGSLIGIAKRSRAKQ